MYVKLPFGTFKYDLDTEYAYKHSFVLSGILTTKVHLDKFNILDVSIYSNSCLIVFHNLKHSTSYKIIVFPTEGKIPKLVISQDDNQIIKNSLDELTEIFQKVGEDLNPTLILILNSLKYIDYIIQLSISQYIFNIFP